MSESDLISSASCDILMKAEKLQSGVSSRPQDYKYI